MVAGSEMRTVARRRVVGSFGDALLVVEPGGDEAWLCRGKDEWTGPGCGIGLLICDGIGAPNVWFRATTL